MTAKVSVPVGSTAAPEEGVTGAVRVTGWPVTGFGRVGDDLGVGGEVDDLPGVGGGAEVRVVAGLAGGVEVGHGEVVVALGHGEAGTGDGRRRACPTPACWCSWVTGRWGWSGSWWG